MKNLIIFSILLISSCTRGESEKYTIKCRIISCEKKEIISVFDEINKYKWISKTSCGNSITTSKRYPIGDSIEFTGYKLR